MSDYRFKNIINIFVPISASAFMLSLPILWWPSDRFIDSTLLFLIFFVILIILNHQLGSIKKLNISSFNKNIRFVMGIFMVFVIITCYIDLYRFFLM